MIINPTNTCRLFALAVALLPAFGQARAAENESSIENEVLTVQFDSAAQTFSIHHKPSNRTFIRDGRLRHGDGKAVVGEVTHPVLGRGRAITVDVSTAEVVRMAVCPGLPFVVFDSTLRNPSKDPIDTHALALFTAELVTGAGTSVLVSGPATEPLGGLNKTYQTVATLLPFSQPHGAVAGWVTHNRGSGVIETRAANNKAILMPRLDFGSLRRRPGTKTAGEFGPGKQFLNANAQQFPSGMKGVADSIRAAGLTPALWYMPFAGEMADPYFKIHPDWFIKRRSKDVPYQTHWGGTCLDATVPEVQGYMRKVAGTLSKEWGYPVLKMDGLYMGCGIDNASSTAAISDLSDAAYKDAEKTNIETFRDGLKRVREAVGPDTFLLGCNVHHSMRTLGGAFGLVDAMRIGPDTQAEMSACVNPGFCRYFTPASFPCSAAVSPAARPAGQCPAPCQSHANARAVDNAPPARYCSALSNT